MSAKGQNGDYKKVCFWFSRDKFRPANTCFIQKRGDAKFCRNKAFFLNLDLFCVHWTDLRYIHLTITHCNHITRQNPIIANVLVKINSYMYYLFTQHPIDSESQRVLWSMMKLGTHTHTLLCLYRYREAERKRTQLHAREAQRQCFLGLLKNKTCIPWCKLLCHPRWLHGPWSQHSPLPFQVHQCVWRIERLPDLKDIHRSVLGQQ